MTDGKARVLAWFDDGELLRPDWRQPTTVHLARALTRQCGARPPALKDPGLDQATARIEAVIGQPKHLVFVLLDACGSSLVARLDDQSFLRRHKRLDLRSVFPSSTSPALTSLATATWPAAHGITGWWQYLPERGRIVLPLPFLDMNGGADELERREVLPLEPSFCTGPRASLAFFPAEFKDSTFSTYSAGRAVRFGYREVEALFVDIAREVHKSNEPSVTYAYVPNIDSLSHDVGPSHPRVLELTKLLDRALAKLREGLPDDATIVVSADHGQVDIAKSQHHFIKDDSPLLPFLKVPLSGEPTVPMFHVHPGSEQGFAETFTKVYGDHFALLSRDEAFELELFGPTELGRRHASRIGDFLALSREIRHLEYAARGVPERYDSGTHGGLRPDEVTVPLVVA